MKNFLKISLALCLSFVAISLFAQVPENTGGTGTPMTESSDPNDTLTKGPLDGIIEKKVMLERRVLPYEQVRENDLFWEKRVWRVIDVREKMNHCFMYPEEPFLNIILKAAQKDEIAVYSEENDKFTNKIQKEEVASKISSIDTTEIMDPETYETKIKVSRNDLNYQDIKQFRIKEVWYFDAEQATLRVRILGIAPIRDFYDKKSGNWLYTGAMFWIYYPDCRELFARHQVFNVEGNDASPMSWEDLFEMRYFSSFIIKESNVQDRKIEEIYGKGNDMLVEGEKIKQSIFDFEHDLWSY